MVLCFGLAIDLTLLATASRMLQDQDPLWHIKLGEVILATHHVPDRDLFSYTMAGAPYYDMQWLSQVIMSLAYKLGGFGGVVALTALAAALAFALLYRELLRRLSDPTALALAGIAVVLCMSHMSARPHVLVSPIMVAWTIWLIRSAEAGQAPPLVLLPLMTLWANMHGSFLFGLALILPFAIEAMLRAGNQRFLAAWCWLGFAALAVAAASLSPYGIGQLTAPLRVLDLGKAANWIVEMRPQDFSEPNLFELFVLFALGCVFFSGITIPAPRLVMLLLLLHLALSHTRHADFLGLVGPLIVAESIARRFPETASLAPRVPWLTQVVFALCIAALA
ncbi:MAG TPA: hypothetical protein VME69_10265 [Methylocella sp.]|nr:hypothetical protein [Methylocella sp.]